MSLINKMLQDLDARGGARVDGLQQQELKAVPVAERDRRPLLLAGGALALVAAAALGWYGWHATRAPTGPVPLMAPATPVTSAATPAAAASAPAGVAAAPPGSTVNPASAAAATTAVAASAAEQAPVAAAQDGPPPAGPVAATPQAQPRTAGSAQATRAPAAAARHGRDTETAEPRPPASTASVTPAPAARQGARSGVATAAGKPELTPQQLSVNTYRRALAALQEGRLSVALTELDRALEIDPRNEAARQTYVTLLLENRRPDDAMRQLRLALGIDPRQPGLAMVLARLQLERGGPALETLMTTLPHAAANADYQAFLAGVLQRAQRHAEAARYYQAALKLAPLNGVWWMGLGISLQADQQLADAREAFTRARTGNGITPELLTFINRRLEQLASVQR